MSQQLPAKTETKAASSVDGLAPHVWAALSGVGAAFFLMDISKAQSWTDFIGRAGMPGVILALTTVIWYQEFRAKPAIEQRCREERDEWAGEKKTLIDNFNKRRIDLEKKIETLQERLLADRTEVLKAMQEGERERIEATLQLATSLDKVHEALRSLGSQQGGGTR